MTSATGAFALLDTLVSLGVSHVFGYPGGAILPIYDELYHWEKKNLIKHYLVRHEQAAAHAADAYARATGQVGVCFATSGPGATNLVTGIATACMDSVPLLVITGQVSRAFIGTDAFQETDIFGITMPIVKHSYLIKDARDVSRIIVEAYNMAKHGRPGPVLVDIPKDVGLEEFAYQRYSDSSSSRCRPILKPTAFQLAQFEQMINSSRQPLLYVGGGAQSASRELQQLAEIFQIPVTTTLMGKGCFDETHPLYLGMLGMHGTAYANFAVSECDLLIALGARFDDRVTGKLDEFASSAQVIHVDIDAAEIGKNRIPQLAICSDVKLVLQQLLCSITKPSNDETYPWRKRIASWKQDYPLLIPRHLSYLSAQEILCELASLAPDAIYTTDVGQHQMWAAQLLHVKPRRWLSSSGLGTMGYGLPAAIGAAIANENQQVICISGDASFQMNLQELATISQYRLAIKILIFNNGWQGMVRQWQQAFYGERYSHSYMQDGQPDWMLLAKAYGIKGIQLSSREELTNQLRQILEMKESVLVNCLIQPDENCYPMVAPGKSNAQMLGLTLR
nr:acetohydroxyacid synthase large subunit [Cyanidioschyzonaceae sp. 1]